MSEYPDKLKEYVKSNFKTNADLYLFGLENGFLPRHTNQILKNWQNIDPKFKICLEDGSPTRRHAFYISYKNYSNDPDKIVKFSFE